METAVAHPTQHIEKSVTDNNVIKALSIDNLIFGLDDDTLKILLIKHNHDIESQKWALPGGWIRYNENLRDAAYRLLDEHIGVKDVYLEQVKAFGQTDRFPFDRVITIAYSALIRPESIEVVTSANIEGAEWFDVRDLPPMVFDHAEIVAHGVRQLCIQIRHAPVGFNLLPQKFTLLQLQTVYEAILNVKLDKSNFRRKLMATGLLVELGDKQRGVAHRAAAYYSFDKERYDELTQQGFSLII